MALHDFVEEVQVLGRDLVDKVKALVHEGNVRRIIVRDEHGNTFVEIPVTLAAVGAVLAPVLASVRLGFWRACRIVENLDSLRKSLRQLVLARLIARHISLRKEKWRLRQQMR